MKVGIDVAGYNYSEVEFTQEIIEHYNLNPIQVYLIRSGKQITLRDKQVTIMQVS